MHRRLEPHAVRQARGRGRRIADRRGRDRGGRRCRARRRRRSTRSCSATIGGGFSAQGFTSSLVLQADDAWRFKPATRVENACATGSAAIHQGLKSIAARPGALRARGRRREDDRPARPRDRRGAAQRRLPQGGGRDRGRLCRRVRPDRPALFPALRRSVRCAWPPSPPRTTRTAAPTRSPRCSKDLGFEFCRHVSDKNPLVAGPLKRTDCSLVSDGAAALVLTDVETALAHATRP